VDKGAVVVGDRTPDRQPDRELSQQSECQPDRQADRQAADEKVDVMLRLLGEHRLDDSTDTLFWATIALERQLSLLDTSIPDAIVLRDKTMQARRWLDTDDSPNTDAQNEQEASVLLQDVAVVAVSVLSQVASPQVVTSATTEPPGPDAHTNVHPASQKKKKPKKKKKMSATGDIASGHGSSATAVPDLPTDPWELSEDILQIMAEADEFDRIRGRQF